jgi:hypothetical protein
MRRLLASCLAFVTMPAPLLTPQLGRGGSQQSSQVSQALQRRFQAGEVRLYRIQLNVRSELDGDRAETIGAKTYVRPFSRRAEGRWTWRASHRVLRIEPDGSAEIEETLHDFGGPGAPASPAADPEEEKLRATMNQAMASWVGSGSRILRYRETRSEGAAKVSAEGGPGLGEASPPLLTLWLLRALRPAASLPDRPIVFGDTWQEPRMARIAEWSGVYGTESGEWLEAGNNASSEPAARLLTVQQIVGSVIAGAEKPPEGTARGNFHGESLATLSLSDGRVLEATRSATREISWTLKPVEGLERPPQFRARLSVQIEIQECEGACPSDSESPSAVRPRE